MCRTAVLIAGLCLLLFPIPADGSPETPDVESLRRELQALKERISVLEGRLEKAERLREDRPEKIAGEAEAEKEGEPAYHIGGALRGTYAYRDFDEGSQARGGDLEFDIFRLDVDGAYKGFLVSAQYRWYSYMHVIHHGWIGYDFPGRWQARIGVTQVPFGLLPYASHSWWFGIPYYLGLEDDYDMGVKVIRDSGPWNLQLGFFKNAEWGDASKTERYSFDVVTSEAQQNEETNQLNARLSYRLEHSEESVSEFGVSLQWGGLYNRTTGDTGSYGAGAVHYNGRFGPLNIMLEAARYEYDPENPPGVPGDNVLLGAFASSSLAAAEGTVYVANIGYDVPVDWGPVTMLTFYNDFSILVKDEARYEDSSIDTLGCLITADPVFAYVDLIFGKNAPFLGDGANPLGAATGSDGGWHTRFNINVGYYF